MTVHSISNFIYVETENGAKSEIGGSQSGKTEEECDQSDLEGQLMALGERWTVLCTWVEERAEILRITRDELELLEREKERLIEWLDDRESSLREMDRNPSDNQDELNRQGQLIVVRKLLSLTASSRHSIVCKITYLCGHHGFDFLKDKFLIRKFEA